MEREDAFLKALIQAERNSNPLIVDGAMGTELIRQGLDPSARWNVERPEVIRAVHEDYIAAGARIIYSNTFRGNQVPMEREGLLDRLTELNAAGAALARRAADDALGPGKGFVAGDIGPTGEFMEPYGTRSPEEFYAWYLDQAHALAEGGVDCFILETMFDPSELEIAIRVIKENIGLPIIATMIFDPVGQELKTMMSVTPRGAAQMLDELGADVIGANCGGVTLQQIARIIREMREHTDVPLLAKPNAGLPKLVDNQAVYDMSPEDFAAGMREIHEMGAVALGGCCGTTAEHLRQMVVAVRE